MDTVNCRRPYVVAVTGASGVDYALRLIAQLVELNEKVHLVFSEAARLVLHEEKEVTLANFTKTEHFVPLLGEKILRQVEVFSPRDFTAPMASGSFPVKGMIIIPCSMGTLGAIASGISQNLIHRAADCIIKEGRRLVIVPRETPLSAIHLENMLKLSRLGVRVVPAMPGFYSGVKTLEGMIDFMVGKVLDQFEITHGLYPRWTGSTHAPQRSRHETLT